MRIRIGTRKSKLALYQTDLVIRAIGKEFPQAECEIVPIMTSGDKITDKNLYDIGGKALFLKEIEEQLISGDIDIAVHSLKDVPGILPGGLMIAAVLERADPRDVFVSYNCKSIDELPQSAVIGSSSVRRKVILQKRRPDLQIVQFRGNVPTRLEKIKNGEVDATILASAGLKRLGLFNLAYCHIMSTDEMLPAAGQGTIGIEIRTYDKAMAEICQHINHLRSWYVSQAERAFLTYLDASCRTPLSAYAEITDDKITGKFMMSDFDCSFMEFTSESGDISEAEEIGIRAAKYLKKIIPPN